MRSLGHCSTETGKGAARSLAPGSSKRGGRRSREHTPVHAVKGAASVHGRLQLFVSHFLHGSRLWRGGVQYTSNFSDTYASLSGQP